MRKALRTLVALTTLLALPMGAAAQVTTFDNKIITISQQNTTQKTYLSSSDMTTATNGCYRAAWTLTETPTAENLFFYDAASKKLVSVTTGQVFRLSASSYGHATWNNGSVDASVEFYSSTASGHTSEYVIKLADNRSLYNNGTANSDAASFSESTTTVGYIFTIAEATAPAATFENKLGDYFTNTYVAPTLGTAYGEYSCSGLDEALTACKGLSTTASFTDIQTVVTSLATSLASKTLNVPQAGDFLRVRSKATGDYYLAAGTVTYNGSNRASFETGKATSGETIFYFDGKHLINYSNGFYLANINSSGVFLGYNGEVTEGSIVSFLPSVFTSRAGQFHVMFNDGARSLYCRTTEGCADAAGVPSGSAYDNDGYHFILEKVTELPLTVSEAGYATFIAPVALQIPDDVEAYTFDAKPADGTVKVKQVSGTIQENFGIIVKANAGTYNFPIDYYYDPSAHISNGESYLKGSYLTGTYDTSDNIFIFGKKDSKIGFFKMSSDNRQIHAYRAYYDATDSASGAEGISAFIIDEGSITGINDAIATDATDTTDASTYDLQGRRVSAPTKGLYIKGGKKIYVK